MLHVFGLVDEHKPTRAGFTLQVLHQQYWGPRGEPHWASSNNSDGFAVPTLLGLSPYVASFAVDPFPDYRPSQLVHRAGTATTSSSSASTPRTSHRDAGAGQVRLPADGDPHLVNHYLSSVTLLDRRGTPMPGLGVGSPLKRRWRSRSTAPPTWSGPGTGRGLHQPLREVSVRPADSLAPATLHVDAVGLEKGLLSSPPPRFTTTWPAPAPCRPRMECSTPRRCALQRRGGQQEDRRHAHRSRLRGRGGRHPGHVQARGGQAGTVALVAQGQQSSAGDSRLRDRPRLGLRRGDRAADDRPHRSAGPGEARRSWRLCAPTRPTAGSSSDLRTWASDLYGKA